MFKRVILSTLTVLVLVCRIFVKDQVQAVARSGSETDAITYIRFSNMTEALPVSYIQKGRQLLEGDGEKNIFSILQDTDLEEAPSAEELPYQAEAGQAVYGKGKRPAGSCKVMTNGDWELFPESVEKISV